MAIAGAHARSTQNRWVFDQLAPLISSRATTGTEAARAYQPHGLDRLRALAVGIREANNPLAKRTEKSGTNLARPSLMTATSGPRRPIVTTTTVTADSMAAAEERRTMSNSRGSRA